MTANVEPEEQEALLALFEGQRAGRHAGPREVRERDFRAPRRLSAAASAEARRRLSGVVRSAERELEPLLRSALELELGAVGEVNAERLHDALAEPFAVVRFTVAGQPAWVAWPTEAAVSAVERILGAGDGDGTARALSALEGSLLARVTRAVVAPLLDALGLAVDGFTVASRAKELGTWRDGGPDADPHRLSIEVHLRRGAAETWTLLVHAPVLGSPHLAEARVDANPVAALPAHLAHVACPVSVQLGCAELSLADLLALEVGDVVELDARADRPVRVTVEGRGVAEATLGLSGTRLAVRLLHSLQPHSDDESDS